MPVRVSCPHCRTPCLVAEQHLGVPVKCGRCGRTFTTRANSATTTPPARLDLGAAASSRRRRGGQDDHFLVQRLVCCNLEERHELAVVMVANGSQVIPPIAAALAPLLGNVLNGSVKDIAAAAESLAAACKNASSTAAGAVIWNGQVSIGGVGDCPIYHQSGGRMTRLTGGPMKLAAGDWIVLTFSVLLDEKALQNEIAKAPSSADELAQRLVERDGTDNCTVVVVRGY